LKESKEYLQTQEEILHKLRKKLDKNNFPADFKKTLDDLNTHPIELIDIVDLLKELGCHFLAIKVVCYHR